MCIRASQTIIFEIPFSAIPILTQMQVTKGGSISNVCMVLKFMSGLQCACVLPSMYI